MLDVLLVRGGIASIRDIATAFLAHDESQIDYYQEIVKRMPGRVLASHGIVQRQNDEYRLHEDVASLSTQEREDLIVRCHEAVEKFGSSAESVGSFGFRSLTQRMVQGDFEAAIGPKPVRLSGGQFRFVVEPLDDGSRNLPAGAKPIQE
jgi:hypothetical protein